MPTFLRIFPLFQQSLEPSHKLEISKHLFQTNSRKLPNTYRRKPIREHPLKNDCFSTRNRDLKVGTQWPHYVSRAVKPRRMAFSGTYCNITEHGGVVRWYSRTFGKDLGWWNLGNVTSKNRRVQVKLTACRLVTIITLKAGHLSWWLWTFVEQIW